MDILFVAFKGPALQSKVLCGFIAVTDSEIKRQRAFGSDAGLQTGKGKRQIRGRR